MIRVFTSPALREALSELERQQLVNDFKAYVGGDFRPNFGRDVAYDHANTPRKVLFHQVRHLHLFDPGKPWEREAPPFRKTSDHHLVYCTGQLDEHCYLLMAILSPEAHQKARNSAIMERLGLMAEQFRARY
ncbi:type II toxin-antitoxin system YafO family toxin [Haliea atlantica]|nr:toxin YafO [Haliea sp.]